MRGARLRVPRAETGGGSLVTGHRQQAADGRTSVDYPQTHSMKKSRAYLSAVLRSPCLHVARNPRENRATRVKPSVIPSERSSNLEALYRDGLGFLDSLR